MCVHAGLHDPDCVKIIHVDGGLHLLPMIFSINVCLCDRKKDVTGHTDQQIQTSSVVEYRHVDCVMG